MRFTTKNYCLRNFNGVSHTTLNPNGPGVVRIHLVPAKEPWKDPSMVILNGQDIIPINPTWAVMLDILIKEINPYHGREITEEDIDSIIDNTIAKARKIYFFTSKKRMMNDIKLIMNTLVAVAYGEEPPVEIGYIPLGEYATKMRAPHRMDLMVSAMTKNGYWHCNQKCLHCYAAGQKESEVVELSTEEWMEILDELKEIGIPQVRGTR